MKTGIHGSLKKKTIYKEGHIYEDHPGNVNYTLPVLF